MNTPPTHSESAHQDGSLVLPMLCMINGRYSYKFGFSTDQIRPKHFFVADLKETISFKGNHKVG